MTAIPQTSAELLGRVVRVALVDAQPLALVLMAGAAHPTLPPGICLGVCADGDAGWITAEEVADWTPACETCGGTRWWWTPSAVIFCAACTPPSPDWELLWKDLRIMLDCLIPEVRELPAVQAKITTCDDAFLTQDYPAFLRSAVALKGLYLLMTWLTGGQGRST